MTVGPSTSALAWQTAEMCLEININPHRAAGIMVYQSAVNHL
jgi:hypothetical protein